MKRLWLLTLLALLLIGCSPNKAIADMTPGERETILNGANEYFKPSYRINLMPVPVPVTVVSIGEVSHGVFRVKYKTYALVVRDGAGHLWNLDVGSEWASVKVGDVIREALDAKALE